MDPTLILYNKAQRELAKTVFYTECQGRDKRFYEILIEMCQERIGQQEQEPMTPEEIKKFENSEMSFGVHKGEKINEISPGYLVYIIENPFVMKLKKYIATKRFKERQGYE